MINVNYKNVEKLVNKENNFLKSSGDLIQNMYKDFIWFSNMFCTAEKKVKDKNLDSGVTKAIDQAMRKLGKNPDQSIKVVEAKIKDCKDKKKPFKENTIRGLGGLLNTAPAEKTLDEVITEFFNSTTKKFDISTVKLVEAIANNQSKNKVEKSLEDQQSKQLHDIEVAKDMQLIASNS